MKFPKCPWPEDIWPMTDSDYVKAIPDPNLRTAISGFLMRKGWEVLKNQLEEKEGWRECPYLEMTIFMGEMEEVQCRIEIEKQTFNICDNCPACE